MPLPEGTDRTANQPWPPVPVRPAMDKIGEWAAWYSGDPDKLEFVYTRISQRLTMTGLTIRPSQYAGGIKGRVARWFHGTPPSPGEPRTALHVPLPADIAQVSSDLLFSEPLSIKHPDRATQDQLSKLLDDTLHAQLLEGAEVCAGLGGVYLRAVWDTEAYPDGPWLSSIHADAAVPEWSYGRLKAVTFWQIIHQENNTVYRWLERHEPGRIFHGVYKGTPEALGRVQPLGDFPETAPFADQVDDRSAILTGIDRLTAVYVPNMRPNKLWRDQPANCHLGRSDYASVEGIFDALDETYTSLMRDIRLGKGRVFVPSVYLQNNKPGDGAYWDPERAIYEGLNMLPGNDSGGQLTVAQFEIRVEEHLATALDLTKKAIGTAGYSGQSFGLVDDGAAMTATEVTARKEKSLSTRDKKIRYERPALQYMLGVFADIGRVHFRWPTSGAVLPEVIWPEAVQIDPETNARTIQLLDAARAISVETKVVMANPGRKDDAEWIKAETKRVLEENQIGPSFAPEDPGTFRGDASAKPGDKADGKPESNGKPAPAKETTA